MSTLFFTARSGDLTPTDTLENVRSTVTTVDKDADASVATSTPERNRLETDAITDGGLTTHQVASQVTPSERYVPPTMDTANSDHNVATNARWSEVGTAAQREASGEWGHGTAYSQDAMTRIPDGTAFNETYFARERRGPNEQVTPYTTPTPGGSQEARENISDAAMVAGRQAMSANIYQDMYNSRMGIN